jgi:hypothetical protein
MNSNKQDAENRAENRLSNDLQALEKQMTSKDLFRLAQARKEALSQSRTTQKRLLWPVLGSSLASLALIVVLLNPAEQTIPATDISMTEVQVDEPLIELYEDLDFYDWLANAET